MALPKSLYSNEYYNNMSQLRDEALVRSNMYGSRRRIGKLVLGSAEAQWTTYDSSTAILYDRGIRVGNETLWRRFPTTLVFYDSYGHAGTLVTRYCMDLDGVNCINVDSHILKTDGSGDMAPIPQRADDDGRDFQKPTKQQRIRIYEELERGASGAHRRRVGYLDGAS